MTSQDPQKKLKIAVVGGGLVGSLQACYMAKRGHQVELYELRDDIRTMEHVPGKSINLAMSIRGRSALREVGLEDEIIKNHGLPMEARMIHRLDGSTYQIPYGKKGQCIYSVGRRFVNEVLLNAAEKLPNVSFNFSHKLVNSDLDKGTMTFTNKSGELVEAQADLILGTDGAYSAVRKQFMKRPRFNYQQEYIPCYYLELCIPPTASGNFAMNPKCLHIWPRGSFMMIALPNQDASWTVTLFMPHDKFEALTTPEELLAFFKTYYPDAIPLIGKDRLVKDFFSIKPSGLISVKCYPHHAGKALLLGDAAHAMVPFYGQGMNCGFEDCLVLNEFLNQLGDHNLEKVLPAYTEHRHVDAHAICDLALYNFIEMRDLVNRFSFLARKRFDNTMHWLFPNWWVPLYTSVTFSRMRYHLCIENKKWQDRGVRKLLWSTGTAVVATAVVVGFNFRSYLQKFI
ncbi:kynurenine 3-monooxygenase-like [Daphnia pulicaria]|uniref:kynurenine 3-monooxygenase-like n=1 Tax=Daphnia pulicaria TaxID=35523 RepID=UPI001EEBE6EE|nr:kynurenine 3-monooxygenase-like [Daphnia pulicaria]